MSRQTDCPARPPLPFQPAGVGVPGCILSRLTRVCQGGKNRVLCSHHQSSWTAVWRDETANRPLPGCFQCPQDTGEPHQPTAHPHTCCRGGRDAAPPCWLFPVLISPFKQILPSELSLTCSCSRGSDPILYSVSYVLCIW